MRSTTRQLSMTKLVIKGKQFMDRQSRPDVSVTKTLMRVRSCTIFLSFSTQCLVGIKQRKTEADI